MGRQELEEGVGKKEGIVYPLIGRRNTKHPLSSLKTRMFPKRSCEWCGWITKNRIDEDPVMGGHDLCFDKTCQWRLCLETQSERRENGSKC